MAEYDGGMAVLALESGIEAISVLVTAKEIAGLVILGLNGTKT